MDENTFLCDRELAARYGVSRPTIWRWSQANRFPKPIQLQPGTTRWRADDVLKWEAEREATRASA